MAPGMGIGSQLHLPEGQPSLKSIETMLHEIVGTQDKVHIDRESLVTVIWTELLYTYNERLELN